MSATAQSIKELLHREPFVPFGLILSSGGHHDICSPESTVIMKSEIFIAFPDGERWSLVAPVRVSAMETLSNGHDTANARD